MSHYQVHLKNVKGHALIEGDEIVYHGNIVGITNNGYPVAAIPNGELIAILEVEASSVPPKEVFLDQQTELQTLKVKHEALRIKMGAHIADRRTALDRVEKLEGELFSATAWLGWLSLAFAVSTIVAIGLTLKLVFWS